MFRKYRRVIGSLALATIGIVGTSLPTASAKSAPKSPDLWVTGYEFISVFQGAALKNTGKNAPTISFGSTSFFDPLSIAFDAHQNVWIAYDGTSSGAPPVIEIAKSQLGPLKHGKAIKAKVILKNKGKSDTPFVIPEGLGFDADGNLWVSDPGRNGVMEFTAKQIRNSGGPTPTIFISSPTFIPGQVRFDASNNLWVEQFQSSGPQQIWRFTPTDRSASGSPTPSLVIDLPDDLDPVDHGFDSSGNLWIAGGGDDGNAIEEIASSDLSGTGEVSPSAAVTITSDAFGTVVGSGSCLGGLDFDESGDMWVSVGANNPTCEADTQVVEFAEGQLGSGGSLTPDVAIEQNNKQTNLLLPGVVRFGPKP